MWRVVFSALIVAASLAPAQTPEEAGLAPEILNLAKIKLRMEENLNSLPNYTCTQTTERSRRNAANRRFQLIDTLRLEVALSNGKELYGWPGSRRFDDRDLTDMVSGGAIGTGAFGSHARSVFLSNAAKFEFAGEQLHEGKPVLVYRYNVPQIFSGYTIRIGKDKAIVGYFGRVFVDSKSLDLVRLEVHASDIDPILSLKEAYTNMDYARVKIGESDFLLPLGADLTMVDNDGGESRNRMQLSACRQYTGDSTITFDEPPLTNEPAPASKTSTVIELPKGLTIDLRLDAPIVFAKSAVGDPFTGSVTADAKLKGKILVPKGAKVYGRITRLQTSIGVTSIIYLGVEFVRVEFPGGEADLPAYLESAIAALGNGRSSNSASPDHNVDEGAIIVSSAVRELPKGTSMKLRVEPAVTGGPK
jgi:hypothetical protein